MKRKIFVGFLLLTILVSTSVVGYTQSRKKDKVGFYKFETSIHEDKVFQEMILERIEDAWADLKVNLDINEDEYIQTSPFLREELSRNKELKVNKKELSSYILQTIDKNILEMSVGSIVPLIYVKKDGTEIIFCYKEEDGTNVYIRTEFTKNVNEKDGKWNESKSIEKIKGKPIKEL